MVPTVLWAYRRTKKEATRESWVGSGLASRSWFTILSDQKHKDLESDQALRENLDFLPEIRLVVELRVAAYKDRISKVYNKRVLERSLRLRDMVLRKTIATGKAHTVRKLKTN